MSILADILSKIKHLEPRRDIPPGLRSTVSALRKKELNKRRVIILLIFAAIALSSGSVTVYLMQTYLPRTTESHGGKAVVRGLPGEGLKEVEPHTTMKQPGYKPESIKREEIKGRPTLKRKGIAQKERPKVEEIVSPVRRQGHFSNGVKEQPDLSPEDRNSERDLCLYMAGNYEKKGDHYNAISSYKKVLDIEPRNYRVINKIAYILIQIASYEEALKYLDSALSIRHDYVPALINTGIVYAKAEKFSDAEKYLLKALSLEEANQPALFNIATLYEKQGKYDLARGYYLRLKNLGNDQGRLGIERIEGLTNGVRS